MNDFVKICKFLCIFMSFLTWIDSMRCPLCPKGQAAWRGEHRLPQKESIGFVFSNDLTR